MKIILDAMGGDNAPQAPVMGALQAAKDFGAHIVLVGKGEEILQVMNQQGIDTLPDGVEIVHGRGTGALRKAVHELLRTFPGVASYHLAPEDQGGDGMTQVLFR